MIGLVGTRGGDTEVVSLTAGESGQLDTQVFQVQASDFFVELLGQEVHTNGVLGGLSPESDLSEGLVGEGGGHDERGVTASTAQVDQATLSEQDDVATVGKSVTIDLRLDVHLLGGVGVEPLDVNFEIEVTNVAENGVVVHQSHVFTADNVLAAGGSDEDLTLSSGFFHSNDLEAFHGSLESVDRIDFGDQDTGSHTLEGLSAALTDITVTSDDGNLAGNHHIRGTLDAVQKGFTATVQVVELGLGDTVVDVDSGNLQLALLQHLVQVVNTSGGFFGDT